MAEDLARLTGNLADELSRIAEAAARERISPDVLFNETARVLKRAHIEAAIAGHQEVTQTGLSGLLRSIVNTIAPLRGGLSDKLAGELGYLQGFISDIANGLLSEAQIADRFSKYAEGINKTYYGAQTDTQRQAGKTEERRVLNPGESCDDCKALAARDWQPIGTMPEPGEGTQCQGRCNCGKEYR